MVGDATPHPVGYKYGSYTNHLDWRKELAGLARNQVRIFAVQAGGGGAKPERDFWKTLAQETGGKHLTVSKMSTLWPLINAAVARQVSERAFEEVGAELSASGALRGEVATVYEEIRTVRIRRVVRSG